MNNLFNEFDKVSAEAWKQKIQVDLKGADYNETLLWKTQEGIVVKPFYTEEDRTYQEILLPKKGFQICQSITIENEADANSLAVDALKRGANAIQFTADKEFNINSLLKNISSDVTLYFKLSFSSINFINQIAQTCNFKKVFYQIDLYGNLAQTGNWFINKKEDAKLFNNIITSHKNTVFVNAALYQNSGANRAQQLAYALAHTNEYIEQFGKEAIENLHFQFAVGSNYFLEISKLRAFRILLDSLLEKHGVTKHTAHIFCVPSKRNKSLYDYNVNMLRTTSECMSAILGGADTICNLPYDSIYHKSNEFGERIARNQLLILKEESHLSESQEIANGSYYIESLTQQLAEKALLIFKQIEKGGGFLEQLMKGTIQSKIKESAAKEQDEYDKGKLVVLGANKLQNPKDQMKETIEISPFLKKKSIKTIIPPIIEKRLTEDGEKERLNNE